MRSAKLARTQSDYTRFATELKDMAYGVYRPELQRLSPGPPRLTVAGLRYLEDALLTSWNEESGPDVDQFWRLVADQGLPYQRKDHVAAVLARGRIRTRTEYDVVTDNLVALEQEGRISAAEAGKLAEAIDRYERRSRS